MIYFFKIVLAAFLQPILPKKLNIKKLAAVASWAWCGGILKII